MSAYELRVTNKFGVPVATAAGQMHCNLSVPPVGAGEVGRRRRGVRAVPWATSDAGGLFVVSSRPAARHDITIASAGSSTSWPGGRPKTCPALGIEVLTLAIDRRYPTGDKKRSSVLTILRSGLEQIFQQQPLLGEGGGGTHVRIDLAHRAIGCAARRATETHAADRRPRLRARGRRLRCDAGRQGLPPRLAASDPLQHPRHAIPRRGLRSRAPTACGSIATTTRATIWARASTAWKSTFTATPRTSSARSASAASWSSTATSARRSSTGPRGARSTCWATRPAGR